MKQAPKADSTVRKPTAYAWWVVAMLWMICFFNYADRQAIFSVFPLLQKEMKLSTVQLGLLGSAFAWVYGLSGPFSGLLVDRIQRKWAILGGLQFWSVICAASALSRSFGMLLSFRAAEGLGESIYYPASTSLISDYHGQRSRSRALGILVTSVYAGTIGGGFWAGFMAEKYGWRSSFAILGILGSVLGLLLLRLLREKARGSADGESVLLPEVPKGIGERLVSVLRVPTTLVLMAVFVCANFVALVLLAWMPAYLYAHFHLSLARAALIATVFPQCGSIGGAFFGGYLADALSRRTPRGRMLTQTIGVACGAPFVFLCGRAGTVGGAAICLAVWGFAKGMYDANIFASVFDVVGPQTRGTATGLMNCVGWMLGGGAAPVMIGLLAKHIGLGPSISASSLSYAIAALLLIFGMIQTLPRDLLRLPCAAETVPIQAAT
jgi:MFS family permease